MLEETLTVIHLKFRPYPQDDPSSTMDQPINGSGSGPIVEPGKRSGRNSPQNSPRQSVVLEKHVSLTPLTSMTQGRCSVGTAVVEGHLLVVGKCSLYYIYVFTKVIIACRNNKELHKRLRHFPITFLESCT